MSSPPAAAQLAGTPGGQKLDKALADGSTDDAATLARAAYRSFLAEDFRDAEITARMALKADAQGALANAVLGNVLAVMGALDDDLAKVAEAREHVERALAREPTLALAHNAAGVTLAGDGALGEAQREFQKAIELDARLAVAHGDLAWVYWQNKRFEDAEREYREAIRLDPESAISHNGLATVLGSRGRYADMERACRDAIRRYEFRDRILASFYVNLAVSLHEQGQHASALSAVARAKELGLPRHPAYRVIQGELRPLP